MDAAEKEKLKKGLEKVVAGKADLFVAPDVMEALKDGSVETEWPIPGVAVTVSGLLESGQIMVVDKWKPEFRPIEMEK